MIIPHILPHYIRQLFIMLQNSFYDSAPLAPPSMGDIRRQHFCHCMLALLPTQLSTPCTVSEVWNCDFNRLLMDFLVLATLAFALKFYV